MRSFLVITGHYATINSYDVQSTVLDFSTFNHRHTSSDIACVLRMKLQRLGVLKKIIRVTWDGAKHMVNTIDELDLNVRRIWCVVHRLHLTITNALGFWKQKKSQGATVNEEPGIITGYD